MFTQGESCLQELWCSTRVTRPVETIQKYTSLAHRKLSSAIEAIWLMSTHCEASVDGKIITSYIQVGKTVTWLLRLEEWWKILTLKTFQGVYAFEHKLKMVNTFTCFVQYALKFMSAANSHLIFHHLLQLLNEHHVKRDPTKPCILQPREKVGKE